MGKAIDFDAAQALLTKSGKRGAQLLSVLGRQAEFIRAFESEIGNQLLKDALSRAEILLEKIVLEEALEGERAEFRALRHILLSWSSRIEAYYNNLNKI